MDHALREGNAFLNSPLWLWTIKEWGNPNLEEKIAPLLWVFEDFMGVCCGVISLEVAGLLSGSSVRGKMERI